MNSTYLCFTADYAKIIMGACRTHKRIATLDKCKSSDAKESHPCVSPPQLFLGTKTHLDDVSDVH